MKHEHNLTKKQKLGIVGAVGLIGAGLAALNEEKIKEFVHERVEEGAISKEEGKKYVEELLAETSKQKLSLERNLSEKIHSLVLKADEVSQKELKELEEKLEDIKIKELEIELERMKKMRE